MVFLHRLSCQLLLNKNECIIQSVRNIHPSFRASDLIIEESKNKGPVEKDPTKFKFGQVFGEHMLEVHYNVSDGWSKPKICKLHNFSFHPGTKALHYAQQLFEGMKAYRGVDSKIRLFRPDMNMKRMIRTAERTSLPTFEAEELINCMRELIKLDQEWVPENKDGQTNALYIRPTMIGTEGALGVSSAKESMLFVITSPVGAYFDSSKIQPVKLWANPNFVRAWPGGCGDKKMGSNYGPTIKVQAEAGKLGYDQVLWLFGDDHQVTEVGVMNFFIVKKGKDGKKILITPPLDQGLILPGVTRDSIISMTKEWDDIEVIERTVNMKEIIDSLKAGSLIEAFSAGTAAIVSPVGQIHFQGQDLMFPEVHKDSLSQRIFRALNDIYYGKVSPHPWTRLVC